MKWILLIVSIIAGESVCSAQQTTLYFPQIADGNFQGGFWKTSLFITNSAVVGSPVARVTITFTRSDGTPFNLSFQDDQGGLLPAGNQLAFEIAALQTHKFVSTSTGSLASGFATLTSNVPVVANAVFSQFDGTGRLLGEAGVPSTAALSRQILFVDTIAGYKTGVAYANPNPSAADITVQLLNRLGQEVTPTLSQRLTPNQHIALFVDELILSAPSMVGILQIVSSQPVAAIGLRFDPSFALFTTLPSWPISNLPPIVGRYSGVGLARNNAFSFEVSPDRTVTQISANILSCGVDLHSFAINLNPGIPITGQRFSARDIPVPLPGHAHSLDIDGVFFDADGFGGTPEQALGGLSFLSGFSRCSDRWVATTLGPDDFDGWSSAGERRLGSDPNSSLSTPEHKDVPTTPLYGPDPCHDLADNDRDGRIDQADPDCAGATSVAFAKAPLSLTASVPPQQNRKFSQRWRQSVPAFDRKASWYPTALPRRRPRISANAAQEPEIFGGPMLRAGNSARERTPQLSDS